MPLGGMTTVDRFNRLKAIKELSEEGKPDSDIANELGIEVRTVKRNKKYLEELGKADLTPKEVGEKRRELYLELTEASEEAKQLFNDNKKSNLKIARSWYIGWLDAIKLKMQLYGLDNIKQDATLVQINNMNYEPEKIKTDAGKRIADILKREHEKEVGV